MATAIEPHYRALLSALPSPRPDKKTLDEAVKKALEQSADKGPLENRRAQWEFLVKNDILTLAATEGKVYQDPKSGYYDTLCQRLDLALTLSEQNGCEPTFPFSVLEDLLETQTIVSCSHIFSWIESRAGRLTEGMVPQKGKALYLLRTLNELLRRLSKMGNTTLFCGRILTFLSGVFPMDERSGVNLRGEYGPSWEGVKVELEREESMPVDETVPGVSGTDKVEVPPAERMDVDVKKPSPSPAEQKAEFYNTFWSLQLPFSKPSMFSSKSSFAEFQSSVNRVFPVIKEATAKERAMMGSRNGAGGAGAGGGGGGSGSTNKRKRDEEDSNFNEYFFAKFLTSPELLDLEVADTQFRRQFLFQLLILLQHLLTFTPAAKAVWVNNRNRSLHMDFALDDEEASWVTDMVNRVMEELKQTTPNGRTFTDTVGVILERDKNWVRWKNDMCPAFDKEGWAVELEGRKVGMVEATRGARDRMRNPPEEWTHKLGTEALTEIWDMGYRSLDDLKVPFNPGDIKDFHKKIKLEDSRIGLRRQRLEKAEKMRAAAAPKPVPTPTPAPTPAPVVSTTQTSDVKTDVKMDMLDSAVVAPKPISAVPSLLHPSLPAKPGLQSRAASMQDVQMAATTTATTGTVAASTAPTTPAPSTPAPAPAPSSTPVPPPAPPSLAASDKEIAKYEENKQRWSWLALRTAREHLLAYFGKIDGVPYVEKLIHEIEVEKEKERKEIRERAEKEREREKNRGLGAAGGAGAGSAAAGSTGAGSGVEDSGQGSALGDTEMEA